MTELAPLEHAGSRAHAPWRDTTRMTRPGDAIEREADRMAESALRASPPARPVARPAPVMRAVREPLFVDEDEDGFDVATAARGSGAAAPSGFLADVRSSGAGAPLDAGVRGRMEHGFGASFDGVRVHTDASASRLTGAVDARAFTHGRDVFFSQGEYAPGTSVGDRLLAHELAHTLQAPSGGRIARRRKKPLDVSRLSDEDKIKLRGRIRGWADKLTAALDERLAARDGVDPAAEAQWVDAIRDAVRKAEKIADAGDKGVLLARLRAEQELLKDPLYRYAVTANASATVDGVVVRLRLGYKGGRGEYAAIASPQTKLTPEQLDFQRRETARLAKGAKAFVHAAYERHVYQDLGIKHADLETEERSEAEPTTGPDDPSAAAPTLEDRKLLDEFQGALGGMQEDPALPDSERAQLLEKLRKLTPEQRKELYDWIKEAGAAQPGSTGQRSAAELVDRFNALDPASREALAINQSIASDHPREAKPLTDTVRLNLKDKTDTLADAAKTTQQIQSNLDLIRSYNTPSDAAKPLFSIDLGFTPFLEEMAVFQGLLAGGGERNELVHGAGVDLNRALAETLRNLQEDLAWLAAETAFWAGLSVATEGLTGAKAVAMVARLKRVHDLIDKARKVYRVYTAIEETVQFLAGLKSRLQGYLHAFDEARAFYAKLEGLLDKLDSSEDVEGALERQEEALMASLEEQIQGEFGEILEAMYIPEDTSLEELKQILFDVPHGLEALKDLWDYSQSAPDPKPAQYVDVLALKGFRAGRLLFPFVGLLAAEASQQLRIHFPDKSLSDRALSLIEKAATKPGADRKAARKERGARNRSLFGRLRGRDFKPDAGEYERILDLAETNLRARLDKDEPDSGGRHWAPAWLKSSVRTEIVEVNKDLRTKKVNGVRKVKGPDGKTTTNREAIPPPPVRVRVHKGLFGKGKLKVTLKVNPPKTLEVDALSNDDFKGEGIAFGTVPRRQEAILKWLREEGYQVLKTPKGDAFIRLPGGKEATARRSYLRFDGNRIKAGVDPDGFRPFLGASVNDERDLPEGYHIRPNATGDRETVALKRGLRQQAYKRLGLDEGHRLKEGEGWAAPKQLAAAELAYGPQKPYDHVGAVDAMFSDAPGLPRLRKDSRFTTLKQWRAHVASEPDLKTRPNLITGTLGYTVRARAFGDKLGQAHLPELRQSDDKGHLIARRFGGEEPYKNLVPMLTSSNQGGKWFQMERAMAAVYAKPGGHRVRIRIEFGYPHGKTRRPSLIKVKWAELDDRKQTVQPEHDITVENE